LAGAADIVVAAPPVRAGCVGAAWKSAKSSSSILVALTAGSALFTFVLFALLAGS
jgi:hypothetical protein